MKYPYLDKIQKNGDVKKLPQQELPLLCEDIRNFLIESVSSTGGHLSSNLGVAEIVFDKDIFCFRIAPLELQKIELLFRKRKRFQKGFQEFTSKGISL